MSRAEDELEFQLRFASGYDYRREVKFHPARRWRADFVIWPSRPGRSPLMVEVQGVIRGRPGRHQRADGMRRDCEKAAHALIKGYAYLPVTPAQVRLGEALGWIEGILG